MHNTSSDFTKKSRVAATCDGNVAGCALFDQRCSRLRACVQARREHFEYLL